MISADLILHFLAGAPDRRASQKQLLRGLNIRGGERHALKGVLAGLVREGRVAERRHMFELRAAPEPRAAARPGPVRATPEPVRRGEVRGRISLHRDGYGFVTPERPLPSGADIFIPPPATGGAMQGDTVTVELAPKKARLPGEERLEGRVIAVLVRAQALLAGIYHQDPRGDYVQPFDERVRERVRIPADAAAPARAANPHRVLGAPAAQAPASLDGLAVEVELTRFPSAGAPAVGRVVEVLGRPDDFGVDVEITIRKHHLPHRFPPAVLAEAAALPRELPAEELSRRRDFRSLPIVTIDGESARDFDDAVHVARTDAGGYALQVHIADVSYYVAPGSAIDAEARLRGTSVYFPDRAVPMLPAELSTDLCSLRPREDRLVMSCLMEFDARGELLRHEIVPGVIRSAERMTYTQVNAVVEGDAAMRSRFAPLAANFELMAELQGVLYAKRQRRGSIDFDLPEPQITFDEFGLMRAIVKSERNVAHRLIEEFMLAAAETVARHLRAAVESSVYRIHEMPDLKKVADFEQTAAAFGYSLGVGPLPIQTMRVRGRAVEVPQAGKFLISPRNYQKLAAQIAGKPEERILSFLMLRSLKQARYSTQNVGHFALATDCYTHFTSPIRRYPDLMVHRILKSLLDIRQERIQEHLPQEWSRSEGLEPICRQSSEAERRADEAERDLMDWKKVRFMEQRVGEEFAGIILHATRDGFFVELEDQFIEGFVPASVLTDDEYRFRTASLDWIGERSKRRFRLGDRLQVLVDRIDPVRQRILLAPASAPVAGGKAAAGSRGGGAPAAKRRTAATTTGRTDGARPPSPRRRH